MLQVIGHLEHLTRYLGGVALGGTMISVTFGCSFLQISTTGLARLSYGANGNGETAV